MFTPLTYVLVSLFANEQTRVVKRYDGKVSDSISKLLTDKNGLNVEKDINIDVSAVDYNFIGNDRKPFYVCTWLASKSIPELSVDGKNSTGGAAGYFFFENYNGFQFRSLDKLLDEKGRTGIKKYIYTGNPDKPQEYDGKILSVNIERDIDLATEFNTGNICKS
jgi:hypothetical protein